ncbi:GlxA family transcriptional regulator [Microbacterium sp. 22242]|uniref:GlxA family transcriptional regulator n=1 Tax=Microbacterium sp. 22242 TaxID=3453896 RepID=UPI003F838587
MGILVYDNVTMIDVAGPADVFSHANSFGADYETLLVSADGRSVKASNGLTLTAELPAAEAGRLDTVIVPGAYGMISRPFEQALTDAVTTLTAEARRIASVCTGSFLLAQIGLLDYRRATTHWTRAAQFAKAFPRVRVDSEALFVRDGHIITSAGVSSGIDLALAIVEDDCGPRVARQVARQMVVFLQRPGSQSQFSAPSRDHLAADNPLRRLMDTIAADPAGDYSLARMSTIANVSTRSLTRLFHDDIGTTPARYVELIRIEAAQMMLKAGASVAEAAARSGFGTSETLRRVFVARVGSSPSVYQEQVRSAS